MSMLRVVCWFLGHRWFVRPMVQADVAAKQFPPMVCTRCRLVQRDWITS
jgi:hypothetical protein